MFLVWLSSALVCFFVWRAGYTFLAKTDLWYLGFLFSYWTPAGWVLLAIMIWGLATLVIRMVEKGNKRR